MNLHSREVSNAVSNSTTVTFPTAINSSISVGDEVFYTGNTPNPTISSIASDKLSIDFKCKCDDCKSNNLDVCWFSSTI